MISNDQDLQATLERVRQFQLQVANLRRVERSPENYRLSASGYLAELDRMTICGRIRPRRIQASQRRSRGRSRTKKAIVRPLEFSSFKAAVVLTRGDALSIIVLTKPDRLR